MAETKVIMPQMGESIFEGTVTKWLKKEGDRVQRDEPLFEISTDKVDSEIPSPAAGTLQQILVKEGQTVQINTVVAVIGDGAAKPAEGAAPPRPEAPKPEPKPPAGTETGEGGASERVRSSPLVRRIAKEHGIDLASLSSKGTGIQGRITKADILSHLEQGGVREAAPERKGERPAAPGAPAAPHPATSMGGVERVPMTAMRKAIAEHMVMSQRTSAHVTTFFEVDCSRVLKAREKLKPEFESSGVRLTVTPFFMQAAARALKTFPLLNASVVGETIVYKKTINIGIAVNLEWGLIVPVVRNADQKNLLELTRAINDLGERARNRKLAPDDVKDGTFTITNPGQYGATMGTPIIHQPQLAIMGMGVIKKRPVVIDDAIAIRPIIMLALSFDHRIIDGALADMFMSDVQKQLENWEA